MTLTHYLAWWIGSWSGLLIAVIGALAGLTFLGLVIAGLRALWSDLVSGPPLHVSPRDWERVTTEHHPPHLVPFRRRQS